MKLSKSHLRGTILQYRRLLSENEFESRNENLLIFLKKFLTKQKLKSIHVFLPIRRNKEPDVSSLIPWLWEKDIRIIISKTDFKQKQMHHYVYESNTVLATNQFGIPEPIAGNEYKSKIDLILVPLLLADKHGYRLGYGGGFYDRFMRNSNALKVGLSLNPLADAIAQKDEWDVRLDHIITSFENNYA